MKAAPELAVHVSTQATVTDPGAAKLLRGLGAVRVVPAREVTNNSRSYSSNLYVERMIMNNGQDAEGLAQRIAATQRREMNSLGS